MIAGSAFLPAYKAGYQADLPVRERWRERQDAGEGEELFS
jgi:hypothetical protein